VKKVGAEALPANITKVLENAPDLQSLVTQYLPQMAGLANPKILKELQSKVEQWSKKGFNKETLAEAEKYFKDTFGDKAQDAVKAMIPDKLKTLLDSAPALQKLVKDNLPEDVDAGAAFDKIQAKFTEWQKKGFNKETMKEAEKYIMDTFNELKNSKPVKAAADAVPDQLKALYHLSPAVKKMIEANLPDNLSETLSKEGKEAIEEIQAKAKEWSKKGFNADTLKEAESFIKEKLSAMKNSDMAEKIKDFSISDIASAPMLDKLPPSLQSLAKDGIKLVKSLDDDASGAKKEAMKAASDIYNQFTEWMHDDEGFSAERVKEAEQLLKSKMAAINQSLDPLKKRATEAGNEWKNKAVRMTTEFKSSTLLKALPDSLKGKVEEGLKMAEGGISEKKQKVVEEFLEALTADAKKWVSSGKMDKSKIDEAEKLLSKRLEELKAGLKKA